jgi:hypothetical protein
MPLDSGSLLPNNNDANCIPVRWNTQWNVGWRLSLPDIATFHFLRRKITSLLNMGSRQLPDLAAVRQRLLECGRPGP